MQPARQADRLTGMAELFLNPWNSQPITMAAPSSGTAVKKGIGEKVLARIAGGYGTYGVGAWSDDRRQQAMSYRGWNYVGIKAICEEFACLSAEVGARREPDRYKGEIRKAMLRGGKLLDNSRWKRKAISGMQSHEEIEVVDSDHRLVKLLENPNALDTPWSFRFRLMLNLELHGISYIWKIPSEGDGKPAEIWSIPAPWVFPRRSSENNQLIGWFDIRPFYMGAGGMGRFQIPVEEMIQIQYPNPMTPFDGMSPMTAMNVWIDIANATDDANLASMYEGVWPGLIIGMAKDGVDPTDDQIEQLYQRLAERSQGEGKFKRPMFLNSGMEVLAETRGGDEMGFQVTGDNNRDRILAGRNVPKGRVGVTEEVSRATAETSDAVFARRCMKPKLVLIAESMTRGLAHEFDKRLIVFWPDPVSTDPDVKRQDWTFLYTNGLATPNEARHAYEMPAYEHGGDDPMINPGLEPVPWATGEKDEYFEEEPQPGAMGQPAADPATGVAPEQPEETRTDEGPMWKRIGELTDVVTKQQEMMGAVLKMLGREQAAPTFNVHVPRFDTNGVHKSHGAPPSPGLVFNDQSHHWERPEGDGAGKVPVKPSVKVSEKMASDAVSQWVNGSGGPMSKVTLGDITSGTAPPVVNYVYGKTQAALRDAGVTHRDLVRGLTLSKDVLAEMINSKKADWSKAGAWSENEWVAEEFLKLNQGSGKIDVISHAEEVPADRIIASHDSWVEFEKEAGEEGFADEAENVAAVGPSDLVKVMVGKGNKANEVDLDDEDELQELLEGIASGEIEHVELFFSPLANEQSNARIEKHAATPPFPGGVFDDASHRWVKPEGGGTATEEKPAETAPKATPVAPAKSTLFASALSTAIAAGKKAGAAEHWAASKVGQGVNALPFALRAPLKAAYYAGFAVFLAGQKAAKEVARSVGGDEHAARIGGTMAALDNIAAIGAKTASLGFHVHGPHDLALIVPVASASYLAYATVRHPAATFNAAGRGVKAAMAKLKGGKVQKDIVRKASFFETCDRDDKGHCKPGNGTGDTSPPFPGGVFNETSHHWELPQMGASPLAPAPAKTESPIKQGRPQEEVGPLAGGREDIKVKPFSDMASMKLSLTNAVLSAPKLNEEQKKKRSLVVDLVVSKLSPGVIKHLGKTIKTITACHGLGDVCDKFEKMSGEKLESGDIIGGLWSSFWGELTFDGGFEDEGYVDDNGQMSAVGIFSHEIGHAIDTVDKKFSHSKTKEFKKCFAAEIADGQITDYAATDEQEGFAEFCRLLYGSSVGREEVVKKFPMTTGFFISKGLL